MTSAEQRDKIKRLKNLLLDDSEVRAWIASAWDGLSHRLMLELSDPESNARAAFHSAVLAIAYAIQGDAFIRTRIETSSNSRNTTVSMARRDRIANGGGHAQLGRADHIDVLNGSSVATLNYSSE